MQFSFSSIINLLVPFHHLYLFVNIKTCLIDQFSSFWDNIIHCFDWVMFCEERLPE